MLQLESLVFQTETKALEDAVSKIDKLSEALGRLSKAQNDETKSAIDAEKLKQEQAKTSATLAKQLEAESKARLANQKAADAEEKAVSKAAKSQQETSTEGEKTNKVLERQNSILEFMTQGFSRGQASVLAYAKATGAASNEMKELESIVQTQRKLIGGDVFDKSISGLTQLKTQLGEVREAYRQYNDGVELTKNQTRELARDKERIIERLKQAGASFSEIKTAIREHNTEYVAAAKAVNVLLKSEKDLIVSGRESENAIKAVTREEERMRSILNTLNTETSQNATLSEQAATAVARYERNLRLAGVGADEAKKKLEKYKNQLVQVQAVEEKRRIDYLSRSLAPQISDVIVSLGSGMNPFTVMLQQGLQVRDLIGQSQVDAKNLQTAFKTAGAEMVASIKNTAAAMSSLLIGTLVSAAKEVSLAFTTMTRSFYSVVATLPSALQGNAQSLMALSAHASSLGTSFLSFARILAGPVIAAVGTFAIASAQVINATTEMTSNLVQFGASLGITFDQTRQLAAGISDLGVTYATGLQTVGEFAKSGITDFETLKAATEAATRASKSLGVEVKDVAKVYSDIGKKPVETLIELGKANGFVSVETVKSVQALMDQGKEVEATKLAVEAYTLALNNMSGLAESQLSPAQKLWKEIKQAISEAWGELQKFADDSNVFNKLRVVFAGMKLIIEQTYTSLGAIGKLLKSILSGNGIGTIIEDTENKLKGQYTSFTNTVKDALRSQSSLVAGEENLAKARQNTAKGLKGYEEGQKLYNNTIKEGSKSALESKASLEGLTKSQVKLMELLSNPAFAKMAPEQQAAATATLIHAHNQELLVEQMKEREKAAKAAARADASVIKSFEKDMQKFIGMQNAGEGAVQELSKAQIELQNVMDSSKWQSYTVAQQAAIQAEADKADKALRAADAYKAQQKAVEELSEVLQDLAAYNTEVEVSLAGRISDIEFEYSILGKSADEVKRMTIEYEKQRKIAETNAKFQEDQIKFLQDWAEKAKGLEGDALLEEAAKFNAEMQRMDENRVKEIAVIQKEANLEVIKEYQKDWEEMQEVLSDAIYTGLTEGGGAAAKKIREYIKEQLKKKFIMPAIDVVVNMITGGGPGSNYGGIFGDLLGGLFGMFSGGGSSGGTGAIVDAATGAVDTAATIWKAVDSMSTSGGSWMQALANSVSSGVKDALAPLLETSSSGTSMLGSLGAGAAGALWAYNATGGSYVGAYGGAVAGTAAYGAAAGIASGAGATAGMSSAFGAMGPYGWVALAVVAVLADIFADKPDPNIVYQMKSQLGDMSLWEDAIAIETPFGFLGLSSTKSKDVDAKDFMKQLTALAEFDKYLASFMTEDQVASVRKGLDEWTSSARGDERNFGTKPEFALAERLIKISEAVGGTQWEELLNYLKTTNVGSKDRITYASDTGDIESLGEMSLEKFIPEGVTLAELFNLNELVVEFEDAGTAGANALKETLFKTLGGNELETKLVNAEYEFEKVAIQKQLDEINKATEGSLEDLATRLVNAGLTRAEVEEIAINAANASVYEGAGKYVNTVMTEIDLEEITKYIIQGFQATKLQEILQDLNQTITTQGARDWISSMTTTVKDEEGKDIPVDGFNEIVKTLGTVWDALYAMPLDKTSMQIEAIAAQFEALGFTLPKSNDELKKMFEGLNLSQEAGQAAFQGLASLIPALKELQTMALELMGISAESVTSIFRSAMEQATSREEAETLAREASIGMFYEGITNMLLSSVTQAVMDGIIAPMALNLVTASTQSAAIQTSAASVSASVTTQGSMIGATNTATGGTIAGTSVATGGQIAANALTSIVDQAVGMIGVFTSILKDPAMQLALQEIGVAMGQIGGALFDFGQVMKPTSGGGGAGRGSGGGGGGGGGKGGKNEKDLLQEAYDLLIKAIAKERELAQERLDLINEIYEISINAAKELYREVDSTRKKSYAEARLFFDQAVSGIMNGIMPDVDEYRESVQSLMDQVETTVYSTRVDQDRARLLLANELQSVADTLEPEKTALEQQLEYLKNLEETAKAQLDELKGVKDVTMTLVAAIANWEKVSKKTLSDGAAEITIPGFPTPVGNLALGSNAQVAQSFPITSAVVGTSVLSTNSSSVVEAVNELREEVALLRAEVRADVTHNAKTAKLLDRVIPDGRTVSVTADIDGGNL